AVAGCFVTEPVVYSTVTVRERGKWLGPFTNAVAPNSACGEFAADRVAVLSGPAAASSNEAFLRMMRLAGAAIVGERSMGSSGRPSPHRLGRGLTYWAPSWIERWPDGTPVEGLGITPTHHVSAEEPATVDAILEA